MLTVFISSPELAKVPLVIMIAVVFFSQYEKTKLLCEKKSFSLVLKGQKDDQVSEISQQKLLFPIKIKQNLCKNKKKFVFSEALVYCD